MRIESWFGNRNILLAALAVLMGVCAFALAHRYLHAQEAAARQSIAGQYATREVLVAGSEMPIGTPITATLLARRAVPVRYLAGDALDAGAAASVLGRRLVRELRSGEAVTASAIEPAAEPALSSLVEPGLRALTIPVDESSAAAGLISPGDLIDLLLVTHADQAGSGAAAVRPLLQAVRVVATGQQLHRPRSAAAVGGGMDEAQAAAVSYSTLSLHVRPEDAERVLLAQRLGELAIVLRPASDTEAAALGPIDESSLFGAHMSRVARAAPVRIQFIIGGLGPLVRERRIGGLNSLRAEP